MFEILLSLRDPTGWQFNLFQRFIHGVYVFFFQNVQGQVHQGQGMDEFDGHLLDIPG